MRQFAILIPATFDIPAVLSLTMGNMGSLSATHEDWAKLLASLGLQVGLEAYPKIRPVHPTMAAAELINGAARALQLQQSCLATATITGQSVVFRTIRGVQVTLAMRSDGCHLTVDFGRCSTRLATLMASDLFRYQVPTATSLLAQAAGEALLLETAPNPAA